MNDNPRRRAMELEAIGAGYLRDFLAKRGYPQEAVGHERRLRGGGRPDVVLIDPQSREVIGLIEFATSAASFRKNAVNRRMQLASYRAGVGNLDLPGYVVLVDEDSERGEIALRFFEDRREELVEVPASQFPDFETLRTQVLALAASANEAEKKTTVHNLERISIWLLILVGELILLSFWELWDPNWEQLALVAAFGVLLILPFFKKLKLLGVEFEHLI